MFYLLSTLQVTSPNRGDKLDLTGSNQVTWDSVESDPTSFDIQIVNEHVNPPLVKTIATNVQTSAGSYTFSKFAVAVGGDYQINLISTEPHNTGILAQSAQFDVSDAVNSSSTSTSTGTSTAKNTSSTGTNTSTKSSSSTSSSLGTATSTTTSSGVSSSGIRTSSIVVSVVGCVLGSVLALLLSVCH